MSTGWPGCSWAAATQHVDADLAFLDLAEEELLGDPAALAALAEPVVSGSGDGSAAVTA
jgi:hypothetical protein